MKNAFGNKNIGKKKGEGNDISKAGNETAKPIMPFRSVTILKWRNRHFSLSREQYFRQQSPPIPTVERQRCDAGIKQKLLACIAIIAPFSGQRERKESKKCHHARSSLDTDDNSLPPFYQPPTKAQAKCTPSPEFIPDPLPLGGKPALTATWNQQEKEQTKKLHRLRRK